MNFIRELFRTPSAKALAVRELEETKRRLLVAQTLKEHAAASCQCYTATIARLTEYLKND